MAGLKPGKVSLGTIGSSGFGETLLTPEKSREAETVDFFKAIAGLLNPASSISGALNQLLNNPEAFKVFRQSQAPPPPQPQPQAQQSQAPPPPQPQPQAQQSQAPPQPQPQAQQPQPKSPAGKRSLIDILLRDVLLPGGVGFAAGQQKSAGSRALLQALGSLLAFTLSKQNIEREARRKALEQVGG